MEAMLRAEGQQNADARFSFRLQGSYVLDRLRAHSGTGNAVEGCLVAASLPGFRSDPVTIAEHRAAVTAFDIPTLELHKAEGFTGALLSPTLWAAPDEARNLLREANVRLRSSPSDHAHAVESLKRAVQIYPPFAQAWMQLAALQEAAEPEAARASYKNAIAADPAYVFPYQPLLRLETRQAAWQDVLGTATQLLKLSPHNYPEAWYDLAFAADQLHRAPQAEQAARAGIAEDPYHLVPELERLLAKILAKQGDNAEAADHFRSYLQRSPGAPDTIFIERELSLLGNPAPAIPPRAEQERSWAAAGQNALAYNGSLPNFICTEAIERYLEPGQRPYDTLRIQLSYFNRKEDYRVMNPDGQEAQISHDQLHGSISKGEFGSELTEIFSASSQTEFQWDHTTTLRKRPANVYFFRIPLAHSPDTVEALTREGSVVNAKASQQGFVSINAATNHVMRISWQSENVPLNFAMQSGTTQLDYDFIDIGGESHLLPVAAEIRLDSPGERNWNHVEFRNYRKFAADSNITFGTIKQ